MSKKLEPIPVSVWFHPDGRVKPYSCHYRGKTLDLSVLQEEQKGNTIRYICRFDDDDEWEFFEATIVFDKQELTWYMER